MTRSELDALRAQYLTMVPEDFIRGAFFSKAQLEKLLNAHADASGLFFYILPGEGDIKFTMYAEAFDASQKPYPEEGTRGLGDDDGTLEEGVVCPPFMNCPP